MSENAKNPPFTAAPATPSATAASSIPSFAVPACAALACALLPAFFYLRAENSLVEPAEKLGASIAFALALLAGLALAGWIFIRQREQARPLLERPSAPFVAAALLACGVAALAALDAFPDGKLPAIPLACLGAMLVAAGSSTLAALSLERLDQTGPVLLPILVATALLCASLAWLAAWASGSTAACSAVTAAAAFAAALLLRFAKHAAAPAQRPGAASNAQGFHIALQHCGGAVFGLAFNFFTMGLTFWRSSAGVATGDGVPVKPGAYAIVFAVMALVQLTRNRMGGSGKGKDEGVEDWLMLVMLPVAIAIVLVSPFIDSALANVPLAAVNLVPYAGIAALNVLGLVAIARMAQIAGCRILPAFGWTLLVCAASMGAGMALFQLLGQGAQLVSLCVLTLYLCAMVIVSIRQTHRLQAERRESARSGAERACGCIAERYALSPRETEILAFLAHGRGSTYIAEKLCISPETVRTHTKRIYEKCGVHAKEDLLDLVEELS